MHQVQEFVVADTGVGIPPAKLESILKEFEGTNDSAVEASTKAAESSSEPGVGLGLAVVARAVAQLGGQLKVESKVDEGSRFSFLIPLGIYPASRGSSHSLSTPSSTSNQSLRQHSRPPSVGSQRNIEQLVEALTFNHMKGGAVVRTPSPPASS
jgi:hypothetical protein